MSRITVWTIWSIALVLLMAGMGDRFEHSTSAAPPDLTEARAAVTPLPADVREFMHRKLGAAQQVLKGLATEDFETIKSGTALMIEMSKEAMWRQADSAAYVQDTADFVEAAEFVIKRAEEEDLQGAALGYSQLTLSCVNCHKHTRRGGLAAAPRIDNPFVP